jgi:hypothetical protein
VGLAEALEVIAAILAALECTTTRAGGFLRHTAMSSASSANSYGHSETSTDDKMVPLAGIEPALLAETDFESVASTNSATGAMNTERIDQSGGT